MGTRHEIKVIIDGQLKVCQYGQWDGYPTGQGKDIAEFIQDVLKKNQLDKFKDNVRKLSFYTDDEWKQLADQNASYKDYPWLSRDAGAQILNHILTGKAKKFLHHDEAENRSWCEYFYIINLDSETIQKSQTGRGGKKYKFSEWTPELMQRLK